MSLPPDHPPLPERKIGVLLINLGTPDAPEVRAVRRYLAEFLSDPRVVEIPAIAWKPILHGFILRTRPRRSAEAYNQVWTNEGSPLAVIARRQAHALRARFGHRVNVHYAMRYGNPGIAAALGNMVQRGLHANPRCAALSAILRGDDRDCERRRIRGARRDARAAGAADVAALL